MTAAAVIALALSSSVAAAAEVAKPPSGPRQPNAYDTFLDAGEDLVDSDRVGQASQDIYLAGKVTTPELQKLVGANVPALRLLRQGLNQPYRFPFVGNMQADQPEWKHFRQLTRLLVLEGELRRRNHDLIGANASFLDAMTLSLEIPRGGGLVPTLAGWGCETIARRAIWNVVDKWDAATARSFGARLEGLAAKRTILATALREDKRLGLASIPELVRQLDAEEGTNFGPHTQQIKRNYSSWMDQTIAQLGRPYRLRKSVPMPVDPLNRAILPSLQKTVPFEARILAGERLLRIAVALRVYYLDHNTYPATVRGLSPKYLKAIPSDPYGSGEALRYTRRGKTYVLYSIGPDGKDDGGRKIEDKSRSGHQRFGIAPTSKGDFVAGVNY